MVMTKSDTIDQILQFNRNANPQFLAEFSREQLNHYLIRVRVRSIDGETHKLNQSAFETLHDSNKDSFASRINRYHIQ